MSHDIYALERCDAYGLSPEDALRNQFLITETSQGPVAGLVAMAFERCVLHAGADVPVIPMEDTKGRLYGAFIGIGVARDGARVSAESFRAFNSRSPLFARTFAKYVGEMAGRFAVLLDTGRNWALLADPMGHMAVFHNAGTRRVASAEYLTLDAPVMPGPLAGPIAHAQGDLVRSFPMAQGLDAQTALLKGGHALDLTGFEERRIWPANTSLRKVTKSKSGPVIDQMAARLGAVVAALAASGPVSVMLSGRIEDRLLLAALKASGAEAAQLCTVTGADETPDALDLLVAERAGLPLETLSIDEAREQFADDPTARQRLKRLHWVRTGCALRVPREALVNIGGLRPKGAIALSGAGFDALQGGWTPEAGMGAPVTPGLAGMLAFILGPDAQTPEADAFSAHLKAWKASLPKSFQPLSTDFIRLEMHQPAQAVAWHGEADQITLSPFSDRAFIEQALRLPVEMRTGPALIEALLQRLAPELAHLPYPCDSGEAVAVQAAE